VLPRPQSCLDDRRLAGCGHGHVDHLDLVVGEQRLQVRVDAADPVAGGDDPGPFAVEIEDSPDRDTAGSVGGQVGDIHDGPRADDRDRAVVRYRYPQRDLLADGGELGHQISSHHRDPDAPEPAGRPRP
jgi:hypothetical protein